MREQIEQLEDALDAILQGIQDALQAGEILSDELQLAAAQEINALTAEIDDLYNQLDQNPVEGLPPQPTAEQHPQLQQGPFPSSNVNSFRYNPQTQQLWVKFHGADSADSGPVYAYQNVPRHIYDVFSAGRVAPRTSGENQYHRWIRGVTPSLGASLYALIREGGYPYQRISG